MHKAKVKCTAANDEEDFGDVFEERAPKRSRASGSSEKHAPLEQSRPAAKKKKEKEFAWMDSEDEGSAADAEASDEDVKPDADELTLDKLDKVQSFGQMMLLMERGSLQDKLKSNTLGPAEVAATCRALARSKFFDGELLEGLCISLRAMINSGKLTAELATDAIVCFKKLNYYNKDFFKAIAKEFMTKVMTLTADIRNKWLDAMQGFDHKDNRDFMQNLEVLPLMPGNPSYKKVKCAFFAKGDCVLGESCTYAHNDFAPLSLIDITKEESWRRRSVIMTHDQKYVFKERETGQSHKPDPSTWQGPPNWPAGSALGAGSNMGGASSWASGWFEEYRRQVAGRMQEGRGSANA